MKCKLLPSYCILPWPLTFIKLHNRYHRQILFQQLNQCNVVSGERWWEELNKKVEISNSGVIKRFSRPRLRCPCTINGGIIGSFQSASGVLKWSIVTSVQEVTNQSLAVKSSKQQWVSPISRETWTHLCVFFIFLLLQMGQVDFKKQVGCSVWYYLLLYVLNCLVCSFDKTWRKRTVAWTLTTLIVRNKTDCEGFPSDLSHVSCSLLGVT